MSTRTHVLTFFLFLIFCWLRFRFFLTKSSAPPIYQRKKRKIMQRRRRERRRKKPLMPQRVKLVWRIVISPSLLKWRFELVWSQRCGCIRRRTSSFVRRSTLARKAAPGKSHPALGVTTISTISKTKRCLSSAIWRLRRLSDSLVLAWFLLPRYDSSWMSRLWMLSALLRSAFSSQPIVCSPTVFSVDRLRMGPKLN